MAASLLKQTSLVLYWHYMTIAVTMFCVVQESASIAERQRLWQVTEALPQLSAEPALMTAPAQEAEALRKLVVEQERPILSAVDGTLGAKISALSPAQQLTVMDSSRKLQLLKELLQGTLGLSTGGKAKRGQEVRGAGQVAGRQPLLMCEGKGVICGGGP